MTRFDHTNCTHPATPAARGRCRADMANGRRNGRISDLQAAYMRADAAELPYAEYEAMVDIFAMDFGMNLQDAFELVENGPVIF